MPTEPDKSVTGGGPESPHDVQESAQWLRVTLSSIGDGVITTDSKGNCTFLNPVSESLTGWSNADAQGVPLVEVFRIVNEETRAVVENPALRALREGVVVGLANHTLLIGRDGTERPIDDSGAPIRNSQGDVAGVVLVFRDVTERRAAEHKLQHTLEYAESIVRTVRESLLILRADLTVKSANKTFYETFNVTPEQTEGRPIFELGNREWDIPKLRELLEEILPQNSHFDDFEVEHDFADGVGRKTVLLNARRVQEGELLILLAIEDITERRAAEMNVRISELRYRRLFQSAKDGILILDPSSGKITDANPYIAGLIGMDSGALIGKELWEIGLFKDINENKAVFTRLQRDGYVEYDHLPLKNVNGDIVDVEFVSNVYRENGSLVAQCNVRSIAERRLRDQARALQEESRRKDEFLAMLSHELRNPLAPIRSAVHLLRTVQTGSDDPIHKQSLEIIDRQTANLTQIISDLLEVSRVLSGRIRLELQAVDLNRIVQHAIETVQPSFDQRKHKVTFHPCADAVWVSADPTRLEEVIINILGNAAKYTHDDGKGRIEVWCEKNPAFNGHAQIRIRDNGEGIEKELLPLVFDLFTQGDRSLARSAGGLGIGLALARKVVQLHGGTIEAFSPPPQAGNGTELIVRLPLIDAPPLGASQEPQASAEKPQGAEAVRVLMVDDNVDQAMMVAAWLRKRGYSVQSAYTGPDGLKVAQQWRPNVVLLDIGLPGIDGYEVARRIRNASEPGLKEARLIALTGYGRDADVDLARDAGFDGHLVKPYEFADLERLMTSARPAQ